MIGFATFQSTLSQGERHFCTTPFKILRIFQSTLSQGERLYRLSLAYGLIKISIHALARRATRLKLSWLLNVRYFNPRSRKESDMPICNLSVEQQGISIHALARRATGSPTVVNGNNVISIHALARRATPFHSSISSHNKISIHALARRATSDTGN